MRFRINQPTCGQPEIDILSEVVKSNHIGVDGLYTKQFEKEFAALHGCEYGLAVQSGTAALHVALLACNIPIEANVAVPDYTCASSGAAVKMAGGRCVFVDVELTTYGLDVESLKIAHQHSPLWGVMLVHVYGTPARDTLAIKNFCEERGIILIEDCCESPGASLSNGQMMGSIGDLAVFSLRSEKMIGVGEGGIVITNNLHLMSESIYFSHRSKSRDGWKWKYLTNNVGYNYAMPHLLGAFAYAQLDRLALHIERRCEITKIYREQLPWMSWHSSPIGAVGWLNFGLFPLDVDFDEVDPLEVEKTLIEIGMDPRVSEIGEDLMSTGIEVRPGFYPLRLQPTFQQDITSSQETHKVWNSDILTMSGLAFPSHPSLSDNDICTICHEISLAWDRVISRSVSEIISVR